MSLAILHCRAQYGIEAPPVTIEVFLSGGLPAFTVVGMAETAVRESKDRVRGALIRSGFDFPQQQLAADTELFVSDDELTECRQWLQARGLDPAAPAPEQQVSPC